MENDIGFQPQQCVEIFRGIAELYPLRYLYNEGDVVYIGADKYEITDFDENAVSLRNAEFPLFGKEYSREDFEESSRKIPQTTI